MDSQTKTKAVNLEDLQISVREVFNKGFGNSGTCTTAAATPAKEVTLGTIFSLVTDCTLLVKFTHGITSENSTLAVTHTVDGASVTETAKPIYLNGSALEANIIQAGASIMLRYNGTQFDIIGGAGSAEVQVNEVAVISLVSNPTGLQSDLIGATIVVTDDDTSETLLSTTWQGTPIELEVAVPTNYTITVGAVTGFLNPTPQSYSSKTTRTRNVTFEYLSHFVDLGLPSGTIWYKYNIGANSEEEHGLWFSWGNTDGHNPSVDSYSFSDDNYQSTTGCTVQANLGLSYDAAYEFAHYLRMPTEIECEELYTYTDKEFTSVNNQNGVKFMNKEDHSVYIFFPAGGEYENDGNGYIGTRCDYWTSIYSSADYAKHMRITSDLTVNYGIDPRRRGLLIKPVKNN